MSPWGPTIDPTSLHNSPSYTHSSPVSTSITPLPGVAFGNSELSNSCGLPVAFTSSTEPIIVTDIPCSPCDPTNPVSP